jgi:hypothetical protein
MCRWASFVLTKDRELWLPDSDSHQEIISRFGLHADGVRGPNNVNVELYPGPRVTALDDWTNWIFYIDQDDTPDWAPRNDSGAMAEIEARTRAALLRRFKEGFHSVYARGCTALTSLDAKAAKYVYASGCTALTSLDAKAAKTVDASGCTALTSLDAKAAKYVYASGCTALTSLDAKAAETVYARGCTALTSLDAKAAEYVDARGCTALNKTRRKS